MAIKVRNKDRLFQALRKSVPAVDAELRSALAKAGDQFVNTAARLVPVDEGDLRESIEWKPTKATAENGSRSPAIVIQAGADKPGDEAFYVRFVEFGTPSSPKQPFFFPAYRLMRRKIRGMLSRAMGKAIKKSGLGK
jgi:HK97 gp10 family phage protein